MNESISDAVAAFNALSDLRNKINRLLPPQYQDCYDIVRSTSMGSAGLKFGPDGKVAWNEIWTSFCDLALAGGPAHRGSLLHAVPREAVSAAPCRAQAVADEIARGIFLTTQLPANARFAPGWVGVRCEHAVMATWLMQAVIVENVMARRCGDALLVPAGPSFQLQKEIKNVVTAVAKTHHYWAYHMPHQPLAMATDLIEPALHDEIRPAASAYATTLVAMRRGIRQTIALPTTASRRCLGWLGVRCHTEEMAIWLLRAIVVEGVVARREQQVLYLPVAPEFAADERASRLVATLVRACGLWELHQALSYKTLGRHSV